MFSVRQMDRSAELTNMLEVIYEIYGEMGISSHQASAVMAGFAVQA